MLSHSSVRMKELANIYDQNNNLVDTVYTLIEAESYAAEGYYVEFLR